MSPNVVVLVTMNNGKSTSDSIVRRIRGHGRGWIFTTSEFLDLGAESALKKTLSRLSRDRIIRRLARGIYDYPRVHKKLGILSPSRGWRTAWRKLTEEAGLGGLRPHDLRHHAITKLAESPEASEQTIMSIAGHVSREMLEHYSHVRQEAKRRAVESLDNVTITSQLAKWEAEAEQRDAKKPNNNGKNWSGRADLNCRPLAPQASALPG
jgi:hypothetical protein